MPGPLQRRHHPTRTLPLERRRGRRRQVFLIDRLRHRRMPPPRQRRRGHLPPTDHRRPHRLTRQPAARRDHTDQVLVTRRRPHTETLRERPQRAEIGAGHSQVLSRHLRHRLSRDLHASKDETHHRQRERPRCRRTVRYASARPAERQGLRTDLSRGGDQGPGTVRLTVFPA